MPDLNVTVIPSVIEVSVSGVASVLETLNVGLPGQPGAQGEQGNQGPQGDPGVSADQSLNHDSNVRFGSLSIGNDVAVIDSLGSGNFSDANVGGHPVCVLNNGYVQDAHGNPALVTGADYAQSSGGGWPSNLGAFSNDVGFLTPGSDAVFNSLSIAGGTAGIDASGNLFAVNYPPAFPVLSVAGKTGSVSLSNSDISGLGAFATLSSAPVSLISGLATVATSGSYADLINKPTIPSAQVNADWNASSGISSIANKPTTFTPSAHKATHATGGSDSLSPSDIGAASIAQSIAFALALS